MNLSFSFSLYSVSVNFLISIFIRRKRMNDADTLFLNNTGVVDYCLVFRIYKVFCFYREIRKREEKKKKIFLFCCLTGLTEVYCGCVCSQAPESKILAVLYCVSDKSSQAISCVFFSVTSCFNIFPSHTYQWCCTLHIH